MDPNETYSLTAIMEQIEDAESKADRGKPEHAARSLQMAQAMALAAIVERLDRIAARLDRRSTPPDMSVFDLKE